MLEEDVAAGKVPLMLIGVVGSTILGQNDMISKILEIRKKHRFWLHIVGQVGPFRKHMNFEFRLLPLCHFASPLRSLSTYFLRWTAQQSH